MKGNATTKVIPGVDETKSKPRTAMRPGKAAEPTAFKYDVGHTLSFPRNERQSSIEKKPGI